MSDFNKDLLENLKDPEARAEFVKSYAEAEIAEAALKEKQRIVTLIITRMQQMTSDYNSVIKHTGGLLTSSMTYAYSKGINDIIKLITKEEK